MPIAVQSVSTGSAAAGAATVTKPTGVVSGDLLVAIHTSDYDGTLAGLTATGWTASGAGQNLNSAGRGKVWTKAAGGSEPSSYTFGNAGGSTCAVTILRIDGHDPTTPVNVAATWGGSATASASHVAPAVSPSVANTLLISAASSVTQNSGDTYTPASGMTERSDFNAGSWVQQSVDTQALTATGTTGTRTLVLTASKVWIAVSIVIAPATGGTDLNLTDFPIAGRGGKTGEALVIDVVLADAPRAGRGNITLDLAAIGVVLADRPGSSRTNTTTDALAIGVSLADTCGQASAGGPPEQVQIGVALVDTAQSARAGGPAEALVVDQVLTDTPSAARAGRTVEQIGGDLVLPFVAGHARAGGGTEMVVADLVLVDAPSGARAGGTTSTALNSTVLTDSPVAARAGGTASIIVLDVILTDQLGTVRAGGSTEQAAAGLTLVSTAGQARAGGLQEQVVNATALMLGVGQASAGGTAERIVLDLVLQDTPGSARAHSGVLTLGAVVPDDRDITLTYEPLTSPWSMTLIGDPDHAGGLTSGWSFSRLEDA